ncbi:hypothetical protein NKH10_25440 [Mesorhizobium sp. M1340]|uniref:hypothetical protein n=1 Tax=Mesorhizobium sp. M1340 TaxID=2957087 RepID=UPI00333A20F9
MRNDDRRAWDDAVEVDLAIRTGLRGIRGEVFLHRVTVIGAPMHALRSQNPNKTCEFRDSRKEPEAVIRLG